MDVERCIICGINRQEQNQVRMVAHYDCTNAPPVRKRAKMDEGTDGSYIPAEEDKGLRFTVVFSMKEEKGALVKALELCKVL